jgi:hypothetical protein
MKCLHSLTGLIGRDSTGTGRPAYPYLDYVKTKMKIWREKF